MKIITAHNYRLRHQKNRRCKRAARGGEEARHRGARRILILAHSLLYGVDVFYDQ